MATVNIWTHDEKFNKADAVVHPDLASGLSDVRLIEIIDIESENGDDGRLILQVVVADRELLSRHPMLQVKQNMARFNSSVRGSFQ